MCMLSKSFAADPELTKNQNLSKEPKLAAGSLSDIEKEDFSIPLRFEVLGGGVDMPPLQLEYDLETSKGKSLSIGGNSFEESTFFVALLPTSKLDSQLSRVMGRELATEYSFIINWPVYLLPEGTFELISRSGNVLWSFDINDRKKKEWNTQLEDWKVKLKNNNVSEVYFTKATLFKTSYGIRNVKEKQTPLWDIKEPLRFCISKYEGNNHTRICSVFYELATSAGLYQMNKLKSTPQPPRVIVNNEEAPLKNNFDVSAGKPVQFYCEISSGASFEFNAIPSQMNLVEMTKGDGKNLIQVVGYGAKPTQEYRLLNQGKADFFEKYFGFDKTIGDLRTFWRTELKMDTPYLFVPGNGGGIFKQRFVINKLPTDKIRPYVHKDTVDGTYIDGVKIFGLKPKATVLSTKQNSVDIDKDEQKEFVWRFGAKNRGQMNRSYLTVKDEEGNSFKAYYELYKGFPREISLRLSGVYGTNKNLILNGEFAFNYWFEDLLSWSQFYISRHRWGVSVKYFQSLNNLKIGTYDSKITNFTADLKYRFNPGLWNRDESWGAVFGFQKVTYSIFDTPTVGAGVFWARSMPKVFDDIFNLLPIFRYPKWVDLEFIYYITPLKTGYAARQPPSGYGNWALNFHGKVMWTDSFFGEGGFGMRQIDLIKDIYNTVDGVYVTRTSLRFTSLYGTVGIGYNF